MHQFYEIMLSMGHGCVLLPSPHGVTESLCPLINAEHTCQSVGQGARDHRALILHSSPVSENMSLTALFLVLSVNSALTKERGMEESRGSGEGGKGSRGEGKRRKMEKAKGFPLTR